MGKEFKLSFWLDDEKYCDGCPCLSTARDRCHAANMRLNEVSVRKLGRIRADLMVVRPHDCPAREKDKNIELPRSI